MAFLETPSAIRRNSVIHYCWKKEEKFASARLQQQPFFIVLNKRSFSEKRIEISGGYYELTTLFSFRLKI